MKIVSFCKGVVASFVLFPTLILLNIVQMLTFAIYPIHKQLCWALNRRMAWAWWGLCTFYLERVYSMEILFRGDNVPIGENAIILPNHQSMADIPLLLCLGWRKKMLGNLKWFVKEALKYVPGPGWGMYLLGCIFLKRNWKQDRPAVVNQLDQYRIHKVPIWLVTFLEGTRAKPEKLKADRAKTLVKNLRPFDYHMYPKREGIIATIQGLRHHVAAVYNVTIGYQGKVPTLWQMLCGEVKQVHIHIIRIEITQVPRADNEIYDFAVTQFRRKDARLTHFQTYGCFCDDSFQDPWRYK